MSKNEVKLLDHIKELVDNAQMMVENKEGDYWEGRYNGLKTAYETLLMYHVVR